MQNLSVSDSPKPEVHLMPPSLFLRLATLVSSKEGASFETDGRLKFEMNWLGTSGQDGVSRIRLPSFLCTRARAHKQTHTHTPRQNT